MGTQELTLGMLDLLSTGLFLQVAKFTSFKHQGSSNRAISGIIASPIIASPSVKHKLCRATPSAVNYGVKVINCDEWCIINDRQRHSFSIAGQTLLAYLYMHVACHSHVKARSVLKLLPFSVSPYGNCLWYVTSFPLVLAEMIMITVACILARVTATSSHV